MNKNIYCQKVPERCMQECPLCGEPQQIMMRGIVPDMEDGSPTVSGDRGYSFCNCRNIFFTNWDNIDKSLYDETYYVKYETENIKTIAVEEIKKLLTILFKFNPTIKSFIEIGSIRDYVLDYVAEQGIETTGLDILSHKSKHNIIISDFEGYRPSSKYDVIHASHVFEHFRSPAEALRKCHSMMTDSGLLYIAMPNTRFIDFSKGRALNWDWHVKEHHIMWNMDDWIIFAEEHNLKCIHSEHGIDLFKKTDGSWFWKQDFKTIFRKA